MSLASFFYPDIYGYICEQRHGKTAAGIGAAVGQRDRLTIAETVTLLAVNCNTARLHIRHLVEHGHLIQHGTGKATWYTLGK